MPTPKSPKQRPGLPVLRIRSTGRPGETIIELDGVRQPGVVRFRVDGTGPDRPCQALLEYRVMVDVETPALVTKQQGDAPDTQVPPVPPGAAGN